MLGRVLKSNSRYDSGWDFNCPDARNGFQSGYVAPIRSLKEPFWNNRA